MLPENAIPAGSQPIDQSPVKETAPGQTTKEAIDQAAKDNLILGKFKSADEVVPAYQELEKDHGRLGAEVGSLRKQNEMLFNLASNATKGGSVQDPGQGKQEPGPDFDKMLSETTNAVESGDMSVGEGLKKVAELTTQKVAALAKQTFTELDTERNAKAVLDQFRKDNPDFQEALQSGEFTAIRAQNPMHDNLSAYYAWKTAKTQTEAEQKVKDAFERGRTETAALAAGADATKRVLGKAGSEARMTNSTTTAIPTTEAGKIQGMMDVLKSARTG